MLTHLLRARRFAPLFWCQFCSALNDNFLKNALGMLILFGIIGALFGPVKYGILPEKLATQELAAGNALVEGATFLAILLGTIGGSVAVTHAKSAGLIVVVIMALAVVC